jgi:integrase
VFPYLGRLKLSAIEARTVESWMAELAKKNFSTKTINGARTVLNGVLKHAFTNGSLSRNPVAATSPYRVSRDEKTQVKEPWTKMEPLRALQAVKGTELDLLVTIGVTFGLRRGEILGLQWTDIDIDAGTLTIDRTLKEERRIHEDGKGRVTLVPDKTKTRASERTLKLGLIFLAALQRHKQYVNGLRQAAGDDWVQTPWVFVSAKGTALYPSNVYRRYVRFCKSNNLRHIHLHDLRHTSAVLAFEAGVRIEAVSQALGHTRIDVTKSIYAPYVQVLADEFTTALDDSLNESLLFMHVLAEDTTEEVA